MLFADLEAHGHTGGSPSCAALTSHGRTQKRMWRKNQKDYREDLDGCKARINEYKDSVAETEKVQKRKRARVERGVEWRADGGSTCGRLWRGKKTTRREQNERISKLAKRGSETANEEQSGNLRKTVRFEQEAPINRRPHPRMCIFNILQVVRNSIGQNPCVQNSSHVDDEIHVSSLDVSTRWMDETIVTSKKCSIGIEMPEISREVN